MDKFTKSVRPSIEATVYDGEIECKKATTAIKRMVNKYPELSWIADCEPEENLSEEYDNYVLEDNDGSFYIAVINHNWN